MFYRYEIKEYNNELALFLYILPNEEFGKDIEHKPKIETKKKIKHYIQNKGIKFHGNKIYIVINGIIIASFDYQHEINLNLDEIVLRQDDRKTIKMSMDNYLKGVLSHEIYPFFHLESLKAQAVLSRTYAIKQMLELGYIDNDNAFQKYVHPNFYKFVWTKQYHEYANKINEAISLTKGEYLVYQNRCINPYFHLTNNGFTEKIPNDISTTSVVSKWDLDSPFYQEVIYDSVENISKLLNVPVIDIKNCEILEVSQTHKVKKIKIGENILDGKIFAQLLGLRSDDFTIQFIDNYIVITTRGDLNNLGLSQYGASELGNRGYTYQQIIKYYFPSATMLKYNNERLQK